MNKKFTWEIHSTLLVAHQTHLNWRTSKLYCIFIFLFYSFIVENSHATQIVCFLKTFCLFSPKFVKDKRINLKCHYSFAWLNGWGWLNFLSYPVPAIIMKHNYPSIILNFMVVLVLHSLSRHCLYNCAPFAFLSLQKQLAFFVKFYALVTCLVLSWINLCGVHPIFRNCPCR